MNVLVTIPNVILKYLELLVIPSGYSIYHFINPAAIFRFRLFGDLAFNPRRRVFNCPVWLRAVSFFGGMVRSMAFAGVNRIRNFRAGVSFRSRKIFIPSVHRLLFVRRDRFRLAIQKFRKKFMGEQSDAGMSLYSSSPS
jgi:hypothetical protein